MNVYREFDIMNVYSEFGTGLQQKPRQEGPSPT